MKNQVLSKICYEFDFLDFKERMGKIANGLREDFDKQLGSKKKQERMEILNLKPFDSTKESDNNLLMDCQGGGDQIVESSTSKQ